MDLDRQSISRSGERPITRWRRESESIEQPRSSTRPSSGVSRSYSKMERPTSRRGIKNDITEYGISRPPTSGKNTVSRPPSANSMINRPPTIAPRLNTMSSINLSRINSGLPRNFPHPNIIDRPATQHSLTTLRPSSSRGDPRAARQIQDKKYYEQILRFKVQEVKQEILILNQYIERHNMEQMDDDPQYDQRSGEFAAQMTELQAQLAEYNACLDKLKLNTEKNYIQNDDERSKELNNKEEVQRNSSPSLVKLQPEEKISPVKKEAYSLYVKIFEIEQKHNRFAGDSLTSAEEKEQLLQKIKQDGLNAAIAEEQKIELETNLESNSGESKKKEDIMDIFKITMEKNKTDELEKFNSIEKQIIEHLDVISSSIDTTLDSSLLDSNDLELLKTLMNQNLENHTDKTLEELKQDNKELRKVLKKLENLEVKIITEMNQLKEKLEDEVIDNHQIYDMSDQDKNDESIEPQKRTGRLECMKRDHSKLIADIERNEIYRLISVLEDKLERMEYENNSLKQTIEEKRKHDDSSALIERLVYLTSQYNKVLMNEMKSVY